MTTPVSRTLCAALAALACDGAAAAIVAAPGAPAAHRPTIDAGGGATRIDIAAPNAAGVSLNQYTRFDVDPAGAVLNNAVGPARSTLLGDIAGNAALGGRAARLIVNQVLGNEPSTLRGMLEVAGARADVLVANPHGIECDGCGFIGVSRAVLLAGEAELDAASGKLGILSTADGTLRVGPGGLREAARAAERIDLIARRIVIAGRVDAHDLRLVAGVNHISNATGGIDPLAGPQPAPPELALDVAAAGAMHAGRIHLIATEAGAGVRSVGELQAHVQDLRLDAAGGLQITRARARRDIALLAAGPIELAHSIDAAREVELRGAALRNGAATVAGGTMRVEVDELSNMGGVLRAGHGLYLLSRGNVSNTLRGEISAGGSLLATVGGDLDNAEGGTIRGARLRLQADGRVDNVAATLQATHGALDVDAQQVENRGGRIHAAGSLLVDLALQGSLNNAGGSLEAQAGALRLVSGFIGNARGRIEAGQAMQLRASQLANAGGRITSKGQAQVVCRDAFDNDSALLQAGQTLTLDAGRQLTNDYGMIAAGSDMRLTLGRSLTNVGGRIEATQGELHLRGMQADVDNDGGDIIAGRMLALDAATLRNGQRARVSGDDVLLAVEQLANRGGRIAALQALRVRAKTIDNSDRGRLIASDGVLLDIGERFDNGGGRVKALGSELVLHAPRAEVDNRGGELRVPLGELRAVARTVHGTLQPVQP
jgi:filamentous hemagglutinin